MPRKFEKTDADAPADTKRFPIGLRVSKSVRERLEQAAADSGRSLSQEVELRLERSFETEDLLPQAASLKYGDDFARIILVAADAALQAGQIYGSAVARDRSDGLERWYEYPTSYQMAVAAIDEVLRLSRPTGGMKEEPAVGLKTPVEIAHDAMASKSMRANFRREDVITGAPNDQIKQTLDAIMSRLVSLERHRIDEKNERNTREAIARHDAREALKHAKERQ